MPAITPSIHSIMSEFTDSWQDNTSLFLHCLHLPRKTSPPKPPAFYQPPIAESGVEAAFSQLFKSWENFQENCVLSFMCGEVRLDSQALQCLITMPDIDVARAFLYSGRQYLDWSEYSKVLDRMKNVFIAPTYELFTQPLKLYKPALDEIIKVRNEIAHSSTKSLKGLEDLAKEYLGGVPGIQRAFDFLEKAPSVSPPYVPILVRNGVIVSNTDTMFEIYAKTLKQAATEMVS